MYKLYLIGMLIIGYGLGVCSASFFHKFCYKCFTDEVSEQYKKLLQKKTYGNESLGLSKFVDIDFEDDEWKFKDGDFIEYDGRGIA